MSPIAREILDYNIVYEYACTFVVGRIEDIRAEAKRVALKTLPSWNFEQSRHGWSYENGSDAGWPLVGRGLVVKAGDPAQPVRLVGPCTFWRAEDSGLLRVRLASPADGTIRVYWRGVPPPIASTKPSEWTAWKQTWFDSARSAEAKIVAGERQWVTIKLAERPAYEGGMTGLGMDVPNGVTVHDVCLGDGGDAQ